MISSTQNYRDVTPTTLAQKANTLYNTVQPLAQATGSILNLASNTANIASLGYKAAMSPFNLFEQGQRISVTNAMSSLNKLNSSFASNPADFTQTQYQLAQKHLETIDNFSSTYGTRGVIRPNITTPEEINSINSVYDAHKEAFGTDFNETRDRLSKLKAEYDLRSAQNPDLGQYSEEDKEILSELEESGTKPTNFRYYLNNIVPNLTAKDNVTIREIEKNSNIYKMYRSKNTPESISKCREAVRKINALSKELIFPQDQRQAILNLKYDYALRSKKWRT